MEQKFNMAMQVCTALHCQVPGTYKREHNKSLAWAHSTSTVAVANLAPSAIPPYHMMCPSEYWGGCSTMSIQNGGGVLLTIKTTASEIA